MTDQERNLLIILGVSFVGLGLLAWWAKTAGLIQNAGATPQDLADAQDQVPPFVSGT